MTSTAIQYSLFTDFDIHLFREGKHYRLFEKLGSHPMKVDGEQGTYFAVWAPNAKEVNLIGHFNDWNKHSLHLIRRSDGSGIWEGFISDIGHGDAYKYAILSQKGIWLEKGDPYARYWEERPNTASIVWDGKYDWKDKKWLTKRAKQDKNATPYSVYEVHLGSWKKKNDGTEHGFYTYLELAEMLVPYVQKMGFTHVELMPIMEFPYDPSWGYQITGYFATTSRFGTPEDFKYLVDTFHQAGIGVILDWVPSHFPQDGHGLGYFDGSRLYEHEDPRLGYHPDWESLIFNYGRYEVRSFLISNAIFWAEQFHADGLRVDAVASMLYLDYSRDEGQWLPNKYGGNQNLEAISFLREMNDALKAEFPDVVTIAEESTAFSGVSRPTETGGLGFDQKWMMGWMHDTLKYFARPSIYRQYHHSEITFSLIYAFSENFMLPLSHDEVVHGKNSLLSKMPEDEWRRFANLRTMYGLMFMHPGSKLLFMGGEFGQYTEWNFKSGLDWSVLEYNHHKGVQQLIIDLNQLYKSNKATYELQFDPSGFEWLSHDDYKNGIITFIRKGKKANDQLLVVCNFLPNVHENYQIGTPESSKWRLVLNSDDKVYGGSGFKALSQLETAPIEKHGKAQSIDLKIAPLSVMVYKKVTKRGK